MSVSMRSWLVGGTLTGLALLAAACGADRGATATIDWRETPPASGTVRDGNASVVAPAAGGSFPLTRIEGPRVGGEGYAVVGEVRYEGVEGVGFLEMWSVFADGGRYFSRTLDTEGPLAAMTGSSDWRAFELPFFLQGAEPPVRLDIGVVLPGEGSVTVSSLELVPIGAAEQGWWSERTAGVIGAAGGSVVGVLGAATAALVARRRARAFTLGVMWVTAVVGAVVLLAGIVGVAVGQPRGVTFTLLLGGVIMTAVFGSGLRTARRAYADAELRRMRALDGV